MKEKTLKWLNAEIIYSIHNSQWVSLVHVVPKNAGVMLTMSEKRREDPDTPSAKWRVCMDYRKHNSATKKDHFPLSLIN